MAKQRPIQETARRQASNNQSATVLLSWGNGPVVPKFGSWDAENIGYTVFFDKVRENKGGPTAAPEPKAAFDGYEFDPYEHYENLSRNVPSRPPSSHRHAPPAQNHRPPPQQQQQHHPPSQRGNGYHRRSGSNGSSAASETSSRGSKFSPPKPYQPRYSNNGYPAHQGGGHVAGGAYAAAPRHHQYAAPPRVAASPPRYAPAPLARATKPSAVPKFGVWDEQNAAAAAATGQGFTMQFEKVKRHREVARVAAPDVQPRMSPEPAAPAPVRPPRRKANRSFLSKVYRCLFPRVRQ
ncbi:hypothetical protein ABZP36_023795 [Zizania latifolia]